MMTTTMTTQHPLSIIIEPPRQRQAVGVTLSDDHTNRQIISTVASRTGKKLDRERRLATMAAAPMVIKAHFAFLCPPRFEFGGKKFKIEIDTSNLAGRNSK